MIGRPDRLPATRVASGGRRRRIVFVNRFYAPDQSATSQLLTDLATALAAGDSDVHVITSRQLYEQPDAALACNESLGGVCVHRVRATQFGRGRLSLRALDYLTFYLSAFIALLRVCSAGDVVVAKTDPPLLSVLGALACRIRGASLVNWLQDLFPEIAARLGVLRERGTPYRLLQCLRDGSLLRAQQNVVLGSRMADYVAERGVPRAKIRIIHNWADESAICPMPADHNSLRVTLDLQGRFVVGYSGNLGRAHEFGTMVEAAALLAGDADIRFLVIGGGARLEAMRAAVLERRLTNFAFLPYQPRASLRLSLTAPDLHIVSLLPSLEGLIVPSKLYGILAAGRPVAFMGSGTGEVTRILRELRCGRHFAVGDAAGLARYIRELAARPALAQTLGSNGRRGFDARFGFRHAAAGWAEMLEAIHGPPTEFESPGNAAQSIQ